ncbi:MAG: MgtC/SapB family protein [Bradymonadaceae bacterium]|nr:MgtC/SapB family protein [Lujinxingiaceae bacterium]
MTIDPSVDWHLFRTVAISLAIGGIVGLERQSHKDPEAGMGSMGVRTFALTALLGTLSVLAQEVAPAVPYVTGVGYFLLMLAFFWHERHTVEQDVGITTQVSALLVFVLGALAPSSPVFAVGVAVVVASILSIKRFTHRFVGLLTPVEILATMKFLLVTVVLLPLLPNTTIDPWGIYNPRELWLLVVLISGISFLAYFAIRFLGTGRGFVLTGMLGGMASSTAVALAMSRQVSRRPRSQKMLLGASFAVLLANAFMFVRVTLAVGIINAKLLSTLWIPFTSMAIPGVLVAGGMWYRLTQYLRNEEARPQRPDAIDEDEELQLRNPFEFFPALKFTLLLVIIIGIANILQSIFGHSAIYVAALFGGIAETNAISLTLARMAASGDLSSTVATQAIVVAILTNSFVKAGLTALIGSKKLGIFVALGMLPILVAGIVSMFLI